MGLAIPRPQMRKREARRIKLRLAKHNELMREYIAQGHSLEKASALAYDDVTGKFADEIIQQLNRESRT